MGLEMPACIMCSVLHIECPCQNMHIPEPTFLCKLLHALGISLCLLFLYKLVYFGGVANLAERRGINHLSYIS